MTFADRVIDFFGTLEFRLTLPDPVQVLNPYADASVQKVFKEFYTKYYSDHDRRIFIFGINPGRFGAGVTGIPFTDPIRLFEICGIKNDFRKSQELSSVFVYETIEAYGGIQKFCSDFYLTAVSPLGFVNNGKNMNYYDDKNLQHVLHDFMLTSIRKQIAFGTPTKSCICLGEGKNFEYLSRLNSEQNFFSKIFPLPHPRWIMQYRRKEMNEYVEAYISTLNELKLNADK